ncbi:hypothetical protein RLON56S_02174 [Alishewanella longhuensis]
MRIFEISREFRGKIYTASVTVDKGIISVSCPILGSKHAKESANNEFMAGLLLQELIDHSNRLNNE